MLKAQNGPEIAPLFDETKLQYHDKILEQQYGIIKDLHRKHKCLLVPDIISYLQITKVYNFHAIKY